MSPQLDVDKQPKRTLVLGKDWFHAIKMNPQTRKDSSIPGGEETQNDRYKARLYSPDTNGRCCVGIYLKACGMSDNMLKDESTVSGINVNIAELLPQEALWLVRPVSSQIPFSLSSDDANLLYYTNDGRGGFNKNQSPEEFKENQRATIRDTFARHNVEVIFED